MHPVKQKALHKKIADENAGLYARNVEETVSISQWCVPNPISDGYVHVQNTSCTR